MSLQNLYAKLHEFEKKSKAVQDKAAEKSKSAAKHADSAKRDAWRRIQQQPELAQFLSECRAAFGKPESVMVEIEGDEIWRQP